MASPTTATLQTIRYEQPPVLQHVSAYGSETLVPNDDICRLSYYLKCCVVGCGIDIGIEDDLLDYMNAHQLSAEQQEKILQHALSDLNALSLLNRAFILDDKHTLLPRGTLNTFRNHDCLRIFLHQFIYHCYGSTSLHSQGHALYAQVDERILY